jgi:hypothetical protein
MLHILAGDSRGDVDRVLEAAESAEPLRWIVPKNAHVGDRVLFHLPKLGFAARGAIATETRPSRSWRNKYSARVGKIVLLAPAVPLAFVRDNHPEWKWPTLPRGLTTIDGAIEKRLEELLGHYQASLAEPLTEGGPKATSATTYERDPLARQRCIAHYGTDCYACGFSFLKGYGEIARGYIHVHHLEPMALKGARHIVDPIKDLRPICPNCHCGIHLQNPPMSIDELKRILLSNADS